MADKRRMLTAAIMMMVIGTAVGAPCRARSDVHTNNNEHKKQQSDEAIIMDQPADQEGLKQLKQAAPIPDKTPPKKELIVKKEGLNNITLEQVINLQAEEIPNLRPKLHKRAIPTWKYKPDVNISRIPQLIIYADCSSSTCETGNKAKPVFAPKLMAFAFTDEDGVTKYSVKKKQVAVACVCVGPKVDVRRPSRKKNRKGRRKGKRRQYKKRHGGKE